VSRVIATVSSPAIFPHRPWLFSGCYCLWTAGRRDVERRDLEDVCDLLGLHRVTLANLMEPTAPRAATAERVMSSPGVVGESLRGRSVCFTGEIVSMRGGERITREMAEQLVTEAGLEVRQSVTKKLDILVVADPDTQSGKARKAQQYGVRIIAERALWQALGVAVE
jgi:DNA polymerase-3 subunit epsilon